MNDYSTLRTLIRNELSAVPIEHWGYYFPCHVAVWRFLEAARPGVLDALAAGYDTEPYFLGKGSSWFVNRLGNDLEYLDVVDKIMRVVVDSLGSKLREKSNLDVNQMPEIDELLIARLARISLEKLDRDAADGRIV